MVDTVALYFRELFGKGEELTKVPQYWQTYLTVFKCPNFATQTRSSDGADTRTRLEDGFGPRRGSGRRANIKS